MVDKGIQKLNHLDFKSAAAEHPGSKRRETGLDAIIQQQDQYRSLRLLSARVIQVSISQLRICVARLLPQCPVIAVLTPLLSKDRKGETFLSRLLSFLIVDSLLHLASNGFLYAQNGFISTWVCSVKRIISVATNDTSALPSNPATTPFLFYHLLFPIGEYLYGSPNVSNVQRLPFDICLKWASSSRLRYEVRTLKPVAEHSTLNLPRTISLYRYLHYYQSQNIMEPNGIYIILSVARLSPIGESTSPTKTRSSAFSTMPNNATSGWLVIRHGRAQIDQILGNPSMTSQTPESRCRAWALDGHVPTRVARLHNMGIVDVADTSVVIAKAYELADMVRASIELGQGNIMLRRYNFISPFWVFL
ncbi:conserved hypothetical protein [Histoplasma capsulatum var. duboisii H88]|uniref:Uncharacterized protein n=2 Tax=Ajellomyces capsulatus TaxID=5037 RepID=F0UUE1_AJEC8|nr:conserved hypothetical protein [Histoplasma capsulatum H143]EGC49518.1 conserved hypothetical protein [Histoplasma capsulatum var. duboisii H88]